MQTLEAYIEITQDCKTEEDLFRQFDIFVGSYGVDVSTYHCPSSYKMAQT
jgi:hypothetical protein